MSLCNCSLVTCAPTLAGAMAWKRPLRTLGGAESVMASHMKGARLAFTKPALLDTLRITCGWAWTYLVVAELVAASSGLGYISLKDLNWRARPYSAWLAYGQSKLANLLFTTELQRLLSAAGSPVRAVAAHPGYSATNLQGQTGSATGDKIFKAANALATDADFGARQTLYAAAADIPGDTFIGPRFGMRGPTGPSPRSPLARNSATASALWALSAQLTDTEFRI